jgi:hypothetical protein
VESIKHNFNLQQFSGKGAKPNTSDWIPDVRSLDFEWTHGTMNKFNDCASTVPPTVAGDSSYSTPQGFVASRCDKAIKPFQQSENIQSIKQVESILQGMLNSCNEHEIFFFSPNITLDMKETNDVPQEPSVDTSTISYWKFPHDNEGTLNAQKIFLHFNL